MIRNNTLVIGSICFVLLLLISFVGPYLPMIDKELNEEPVRMIDGKIISLPFPPSELNLLGTDDKGRDLLSLIVVGAKETLLIVFVIALVRYIIAIPLGAISSNSTGILHWLLFKWNSIFSTIPTLFAAILLLKLPFVILAENRTLWIILILAFLEVGRISHVFQQQVHSLSKATFVESGLMVGNSKLGIYIRYFLPYLIPQVIVNFVLDLGKVMLLLGQLGFLSIFISQTFITYDLGIGQLINQSAAWPQLLSESYTHIRRHFWIPFWPSFAIAFSVITFNLFGEGLRQHYEERSTSKYNRKLEQRVMQQIKQGQKNQGYEMM
jgi:peptide/nickel transport system permease protein